MKTHRSTLLLVSGLLLSAGCVGDVTGELGEAGETDTGGELDQERDDVVDDSSPGDGEDTGVDLGAVAQEGLRARIVNTNGLRLRMRSGPSYGYGTIKFMNAGDEVDVLGGPTGDYVPVVHQGQEGWAHGYYLELVDDPEPDAPTPDPTPTAGGTDYLLPWTAGLTYRVSQGHGVGSHSGKGLWAWDFALPSGTPVLAAHDGVVRKARGDSAIGGCDSAYGNSANYVVLDRGDGLESLYLHLSATSVHVGQIVTRGQPIGLSGATGWACGAHLHYQVQRSPDAGGGLGWYNTSQHQYFHDTGEAYDPPGGTFPVSANQ